MGVLDDAIREHLDLKRRHGAAEEELRQQEEEALGPARREVAPADSEDGDGTGEQSPAEVEAAETAHAEQPELDEEHDHEPELSEAIPDSAVRSDAQAGEATALYEVPAEDSDPEAAVEERPAAEHHDEPVGHDEPAHHDEPTDHHEPLGAAPAETAFDEGEPYDEEERAPAGDTPPQGFEARDEEELLEEEGEPSDEDADLLEDTPDFLQETPEHDRLWFEQKPPRDFDFE
jgi:hypothetical protein